MKERIAGGQTVSSFCEEKGISKTTYYYRQKKVREDTCAKLAEKRNSGTGLVPDGWSQLAQAESVTAGKGALTIEIAGLLYQGNRLNGPGVSCKGLPRIEVAVMRFGEKPVYLCCGCTDMRRSINGLTTPVQHSFSLNPFADALSVFCNRSRDRLKILEWDGDGFWLYFKRLERGHFRLPSLDGETTMTLNREELSCLIDGAGLEKKLRRSEVFGDEIP